MDMDANFRLNVVGLLSIVVFVPYADAADGYRVAAITDLIWR